MALIEPGLKRDIEDEEAWDRFWEWVDEKRKWGCIEKKQETKIWKIEVWGDWIVYIYLSNREPTQKELDELKAKHGEKTKIDVEEIEIDGVTLLTYYDECP